MLSLRSSKTALSQQILHEPSVYLNWMYWGGCVINRATLSTFVSLEDVITVNLFHCDLNGLPTGCWEQTVPLLNSTTLPKFTSEPTPYMHYNSLGTYDTNYKVFSSSNLLVGKNNLAMFQLSSLNSIEHCRGFGGEVINK